MEDLEICKRIAEIEGLSARMMKSAFGVKLMIMRNDHGGYGEYNPLTDDALCFRLMVKYQIEFDFKNKRAIYDAPNKDPMYRSWVKFDDIPLKKALCLAIIEAHKE